MKKSLSVLVAGAMVSSMFASLAFADDAADKTTEEKLQELIAAGIFDPEGTGNGYELEAHMTREQLAKILAKLKKLEELDTTQIYDDVETDRWSAGFIAAVSKAVPPLMDGVADGVFDPAGDVTLEQLATVAVRALNLQVKDGDVEGEVSDWAKGYVATALENGLISEKDDYTQPAIRADLVETTYTAREMLADLEKPAKVSIKEAKAVGVQKVQVTLDRDVDTSKATFTLKKGTQTITLANTEWSDDKQTATLTLKDVKISEGTYTVTLGGLDASEIDQASASFTAQNETVTKIEFVTASDEIAKAPKVTLNIKPINQYGEIASFSAGSYSYFVSANNVNPNLTKGDDGLLKLSLDTKDQQTGIGVIPITIYHNDTRVSASKTFKVGTDAYVAKVEVSEPTYSNGEALTAADETATIKLTMYDQYGGLFTKDSIFSDNRNKPNINVLVTPYEPNFYDPIIDTTNYEKVELKLKNGVEKDADYTVTVFAGISSASTKVSVKSTKVATNVELQDYNGVLAAGDENKYIVIEAYDADGNKLTADDIVKNAENGRFNITVNGATIAKASDGDTNVVGDTGIVRYGEHKGQIQLKKIEASARGYVYVSIGIYTVNVQDTAYKNIPVNEARYPATISVDTEPATKSVLNATNKFKFLVKDQYGEKLDKVATGQKKDGINITDRYKVSVTATVYGGAGTVTSQDQTNYPFNGTSQEYTGGDFTGFNKGYVFNMSGSQGKIEFKATLIDTKDGDKEVASVKRTIEAIDPSTNLNYAVSAISDVFAYLDHPLKISTDVADPYNSAMAKSVTITAKDGAGNTVAIPDNLIVGVSSSDVNVVKAVYDASGKAKVIGNKPGTATITVAFKAANGELKSQTVTVNSKSDPVTVASMTADASKAYATPATKEAYTIMNLKVKDNYGVEYSDANIGKYKDYLGVLYTVSNVKLKDPNGTDNSVTVDQSSGNVTVGSNVAEFVLTAISNNGMTVSTLVTN